MGDNASGFKVTLEWALNPENAYKVLEGAIYDKPLESKKEQPAKTPPPEESAEKAQACITNLSDPALQKLSRGLVEKLGVATWLSWFKDLRITARSAHKLVLSCPSRFMRDYIQNHFSAAVLSTAQGIFLTTREIDYGVREPITTKPFPVTEFTARSALSEGGMPELPSEAPLALPDFAGRSKPHEIRTLSSRPQKKVKGQERSEKPAVVPFSQKRQAHE